MIIESAYSSVGGGELLLVCRNDSTAALSGVQRTLALDNGLTGTGSATTSAAANLGNRVPVVRHVGVVSKSLSNSSVLWEDWVMI